ncbi:MAG: hypothetical protein A2Z20_11445 [Bdellovibrionales bacterium RBG_16_40_8]|nr:MAG: hypothetical protein A2Z20_11445 [Bdellovibrionales bacterium RBG_16_40_8]
MHWLKRLFSFNQSSGPDTVEPSVHKLIGVNALNKRKNIRIKYPHFGAFGPFPRVLYMGHEMNVGNISVGGLHIIDDTEKLGSTVSDIIMIELIWGDFSAKVRVRVVGVNLHNRHIQFVDFNAQAYLRISILTKPGYIGSRFHRVRDEFGQLQALELWVGATSESLMFCKKSSSFAELVLNGQKIIFERGRCTYFAESEEPVTPKLLTDILIMIANLNEPTLLVKNLLEIIESDLSNITPNISSKISSKKTGTYG